MDLFEPDKPAKASFPQPLAIRMRPRTLEEVVGQEHLIGPGRLLRRTIEADRFTSLIFYGPPGTGKTALAHVIADATKAHVERLNATSAGVTELRETIVRAKELTRLDGNRTVLFIDEIHRFNKVQQDVLMPDVEQGNPILIGATTFNPFFAILSALLSRSIVCEFKPLKAEHVRILLKRACGDCARGLGPANVRMEDDALAHLAGACDGDARRALNALEVAVLTTPKSKGGSIHVTRKIAEESIQKKAVVYDQKGDSLLLAPQFIKPRSNGLFEAHIRWLVVDTSLLF